MRGDSLSAIASRQKMTLSQLKKLNGLRGNTVKVGQVLKVYSRKGAVATRPSSAGKRTASYRVSRGDSLSVIASRHDMTLSQLKQLNGLRSNTVRIGQVLKVHALGGGGSKATVKYRVVRGDSLSTIASRYGVTQSSLKTANRLRGNTIRIGQVLLIPAS
ncbi:MAG: LysM peptidoglycan-binding domain-containing protein [Marinobacterium sp.]|nr:LysM peptidoglycan-binding domain-containing protein [Marinobacterium sp.]